MTCGQKMLKAGSGKGLHYDDLKSHDEYQNFFSSQQKFKMCVSTFSSYDFVVRRHRKPYKKYQKVLKFMGLKLSKLTIVVT